MADSDTDKAIAALRESDLGSDPAALRAFNRDVVEEFRANGGKVGGTFEGADVLLLTMTGARSGQPRLTPLEYFVIDGRILVVGTYGGAPKDPAWVYNLRANAEAHVEIGTESYDVVAHELSGDEHRKLFAELVRLAPRIGVYRTRTTRQFPIFELRRTDGPGRHMAPAPALP